MIQKKERAFLGSAPSLNIVKLGYGEHIVEAWLMVQIQDLNSFCSVEKKMTEMQLAELARLIIADCGYLKVTELMVFFAQFKLGHYGKFYGVIDPIVITGALDKFLEERVVTLRELKKKAKEIEYERIAKEREKIVMSKEEYEELYWLFNM